MIVSFTQKAKAHLHCPTVQAGFKLKAEPADEPLCCKYVYITGKQLRLAGFNMAGGLPIRHDRPYLVDKSLLQTH